jgi:site-specific DNA recombinase
VRVSTELQAKTGYSLDAQEEFLHDLIERSNGETRPELLLSDNGYEGDNWSRPAIREGLEWIRAGKVKGLAFLDTDRFARDVHGALGFIKDVCKAGGRVLFGDVGEYRGNDAEFLLTFNIKLSLGQFQKAKIKALSRMATLRKVRGGEPHCGGHAPYGFRYEPKTKHSPARLVVVPEEAKIIVLMYMWYTQEGASLRGIARRLIAEGVPAPKSHWNPETVKGILTSETYLGIWSYNKTECIEPQTIRSTGPRHRRRSSKKFRPKSEWEAVPVEPIVSQSLFDAASAKMAGNQHTLGGRPSTTYLAKSVIWCPLCNSRYVGTWNHGYKRYVCSNCRDRVTGEKKCPAPSLAGEPTETALLGAIRDVLGDERQLEASLSEKRRELAAGANAPEIEHLKKRLEQIRRREEKARSEALKAAETGDVDAEAYYDSEIREARALRSEIQNQLRSKTVVVDFKVDVKAIAAAVRKGLELATPGQQQKLIQGVIKRATPLTAKEIEIEFGIPVRDADAQYRQEQQPNRGPGRAAGTGDRHAAHAGRGAGANSSPASDGKPGTVSDRCRVKRRGRGGVRSLDARRGLL